MKPKRQPQTRMMGVHWGRVIHSAPDLSQPAYYPADGDEWLRTRFIVSASFCVAFSDPIPPILYLQDTNDN